jgi:hypothetical protein
MAFTQKELEEAYKQMQAEREKEAKTAQLAANWVRNQLKADIGNLPGMLCEPHVKFVDPERRTGTGRGISPEPKNYVIVCVHETYGPYLKDYEDRLNVAGWAKRNDDWVYGFKPDTPFYDIVTPHGNFKLTFDYFDNHWTGW